MAIPSGESAAPGAEGAAGKMGESGEVYPPRGGSDEVRGGGPSPLGEGAERSEADGAGPLDEIHRRLALAAPGCYPGPARRFGWEGTATLRFCVGPGGEATQVQVAQSSGRALLDQAAADCVVREAQPFPAVKECLVVDVHFARRP